jgi:hypothetical protein
MDITRRQFALALAAANYLRPALFEPLSPLGVPRGVAILPEGAETTATSSQTTRSCVGNR